MFTVERKKLFVLLVFGLIITGSLCSGEENSIDGLEMNGLRLTGYTWHWSGNTIVVPVWIKNISGEDKEDVRIYITGNSVSPWGLLKYQGKGTWETTSSTGYRLSAIIGGERAILPSDQEIHVAPGEPTDAAYPFVKVGDLDAGEERKEEYRVTLHTTYIGKYRWNSPYQQWITLAEGGERVPQGNRPPTAYSESVTTTVDTPVEITLHATDPDGDNLSFHVVSGPSNGTLSGMPPQVTYTPNSGYTGAESFNFVARVVIGMQNSHG